MADVAKQNQVNVVLRYAGAAAGTLFTVFGMMQFVTPDQVAELTKQIHILNDSVLTAYGALTKMWVILGPVGVTLAGYFGVKSSSVKAMGDKLLSIAQNGPSSKEAKQTLIAATIALPEVQTIVTDQKTADESPSQDVVAADQTQQKRAG